MSAQEERLAILRMIENGKISAKEGAELLKAISTQPGPTSTGDSSSFKSEPRWFRVIITDLDSDRQKVDINIPLGLVRVGLRMGARFVPETVNLDERGLLQVVQQAVEEGNKGEVFKADDQTRRENVRVIIE